MSDPLSIYIHDHLAGARVAIELLQAMQTREKTRPLGRFATDMLVEVEADRNTLQALAEKIGAGSNVVKEVTGWLGEKASRIKFSNSPANEFGNFQALEFLALGVLGKLALWDALNVILSSDTRVSQYNFKELAAQARTQHAEVEQQRLEIAVTAFGRKT
jgi:hypothetical protein